MILKFEKDLYYDRRNYFLIITKTKRIYCFPNGNSYELAEIASKVKPKLLILYHQLFWGASEAELVAEVKEGYTGKMVSGNDLQIF